MQVSHVAQGTTVGTQEDASLAIESNGEPTVGRSHDTLNSIPFARTVLAVLDTHRDGDVPEIVVQVARRDGACVVVYDLSTGSLWTTPYGEDDHAERFRDRVLSAGQLRHLGQWAVARVVDNLIRAGIRAGGYLATLPGAGDLTDLVRREQIDLVVAPAPAQGKVVQSNQPVRLHGATLVEYGPGAHLAVFPATTTEDRMQYMQHRSRASWLTWLFQPPAPREHRAR